MNTKSNAVKGFSLIEMMMVLAIAGIVLTIAVPSYRTFTQNNRLTKQINFLAASVAAARGEAAKRGVRVVVCQTQNVTDLGNVCDGTAGDWSNGWIVFSDADNDLTIDAGTDVVVASFRAESGVKILASGNTAFIEFRPDGSVLGNNNIDLAVCDSRGVSHGKTLSLATTGRASSGDADTCTP